MIHSHVSAIPGLKAPRYCNLCRAELALKSVKPGDPDRHECVDCGEVHWLDPKVAVGTLIETEGGLVLLQRAIEPGHGKWVFPGGFVDRGEQVVDAAVREAREEALIEVTDLVLFDVYSYPGHPVILITYTARIASGVPAAGDETLAAKTVPLDRIDFGELAFPSTADAVRELQRRRGVAG